MDYKISIIIPYRDERGYLQEAITSAENQQGFTLGRDYEIILQQGPYRLGKNVNDGVKKAKGKFIKILADDDRLTPNCLLSLYSKIIEGYDFVCADAVNFYESGVTELIHSRIPPHIIELAFENTVHGGTILYRKDSMPLWSENLWTAEEYELTLRMAAMGLKFGYVPHVVYNYRVHSESKSQLCVDVYSTVPVNTESSDYETRWDYIEKIRGPYFENHSKINR